MSVEQVVFSKLEEITEKAREASDSLTEAVLEASQFQTFTHKGARAYELAGFKKWADCERQIAESGFRLAPRQFRRLVDDAKLFPAEFVREIGLAKLKAAARVKRAGRWNENWQACFMQESVTAVQARTRDELRKVYENRKWVRMLLPNSLAEAWDGFRERIKTVMSFETDEEFLDWIVSFWSGVTDEEVLFLTEVGIGGMEHGKAQTK